MYLSPLLLCTLLPALIVADQAPLQDKVAGWFDKAKSYIPSSIPDPIEAAAAAIAGKKVVKINQRNWERYLSPKPEGDEEWIIYLTGGNKTCFGRCGPVDVVWNESASALAALPQSNLHLGFIDCDKEQVLCTAWASTVPSIYHFLIPQQAHPQAKSPLHVVHLNISNTTPADIVSIPSSTKARFEDSKEYEGILHPIDGLMRKYNVLIPFGYVLWGFGSTPSWMVMIGISFISRQMMSRRMNARPGFDTAPPAAGAAAPAPAAAAPAPKSGGSGKKRR